MVVAAQFIKKDPDISFSSFFPLYFFPSTISRRVRWVFVSLSVHESAVFHIYLACSHEWSN